MTNISPPSFVLKNALLYKEPTDVFVQNGCISACGRAGSIDIPSDTPVVDANNQVLFPSFIDVHTHMREPGFEYKEDIQSGLAAAAYGGFGAVFAMANTHPVNDKGTVSRYMVEKAVKHWPHGPTLYPVGALSVGLVGKELAPYGELTEAGCVAISNDGRPVANTELFRRAVEYAAQWGVKIIDHCEDPDLARGYLMNEGITSGSLGVKGQPVVGEATQVARNILLAEYLQLPIHLAHISCAQSVELIAWAKSRGVPITAETCPHYLLLDETSLTTYDAQAKVSPPLRTRKDVTAIKEAVISGVIEILATDHAPHASHEKEETLDKAPFGFIGLETAVSLTYEALVINETLSQQEFVNRWLIAPATTFNLQYNTFSSGDRADFFLFDPDTSWTVSRNTLHSKSINTPFYGKNLKGKVIQHWQNGVALLQK